MLNPFLFIFFPVFLFNCLSLCCQFPAHSTGLKSTFILQLLTQTGYCSASFHSSVPRSPRCAQLFLHSFSSSTLTPCSFLFMWSTIDCFAESWYCVLMFLSTFNKHSHFINGNFSPVAYNINWADIGMNNDCVVPSAWKHLCHPSVANTAEGNK